MRHVTDIAMKLNTWKRVKTRIRSEGFKGYGSTKFIWETNLSPSEPRSKRSMQNQPESDEYTFFCPCTQLTAASPYMVTVVEKASNWQKST